MSGKLFRLLADEQKREEDEAQASRQVSAKAAKAAADFREAWRVAFPINIHFKTDEFRKIVTANLLRLGEGIRERFWDYYLIEYMSEEKLNRHALIAATLLLHAAFNRRKDILEGLDAGATLLNDAIDQHLEMFENMGLIETRAKHQLPATPPLSQTELARLLGVTVPKFRGDKKAGRWEEIVIDPPQRYVRLRRWRHRDDSEHAKALAILRKKIPDRICKQAIQFRNEM